MRFKLPSLIATLLVAGFTGCDNQRATSPSLERSKPEVAQTTSPDPAAAKIATSQFAADAETTLPEPSESEATAKSFDPGIETNSFATLQPTTVIPVSAPQTSPGERSPEIYAENCMVQYINKVNVPAKAEGTLMELKFEEGDRVNRGDVLAVIDDTAAKMAVELKKAEEKEAELNARNEVNLKDAVNSEKLASAEAEAYEELLRESAIPFWEYEKKRLEAERARLRIDLAKMQKKIAEVQYFAKRSEREIAEFELTRRQVTSPSTGFVEARIAQLGEWVQPGSPIATLIQMDRLRVEGDVDVKYDGQILIGTKVQVTIKDSSNEAIKVIAGQLGFVSMEIDLNSRLRVWVEIENEIIDDDWLIKPGMHAEIVIQTPGQIL
jgi:multidrug efflux pump subunit AcrA (membrane-fusion protein)